MLYTWDEYNIVEARMIRSIQLGLAVLSFAGFAAAAQVTGVLMDVHCSGQAREHIASDGQLTGGMIAAEAHDRACDLKPACQSSGYGVYTQDQKFLKFDPAGSRKALEAIKGSTKLDDLTVQVNGVITGDTIKVESLKLL